MSRLCAVTWIWFCVAWAGVGHTAPPNILFILADDVGCETLGCYGGTSYPTPNIDRLASDGLRFEHCYSMPMCHPSRTTLLLGRYPRHTGTPAWGSFPADLERQTVAHILRDAGYATAVAGKWQLALLGDDPGHPHRLGFDEYCLFGWHEGPRYHDPWIWQSGKRRTDTKGKYGPDLYVDFLSDFFARNRERPFFAFYSMALCHDVTDDLETPVPYVPGKDRYLSYAEMMASMDACVGRVVEALDRLGLRDNTLIVFSGDNGTARRSIVRAERYMAGGEISWRYLREPVVSTQHGQSIPGGKGTLTDGGTHVPLICHWPGVIYPGQTADDLVDFSDFLPTFAEIGQGSSSNLSIDGKSFARRLTDGIPPPREWAYAEGKGGAHYVRTQRWKLYSDGRLYDILEDRFEQHDLSATPPTSEDLALLWQAISSL